MNGCLRINIFVRQIRVFFTCIQCRYDIDGYYAFLAVCDPDKKELGRAIIFKDDYLSFEFDFLRWSDDSKKIFYKFKPPQKIYTALVEDIVQGKFAYLDNKMGNFFRETLSHL